jgi:hypothetical protein
MDAARRRRFSDPLTAANAVPYTASPDFVKSVTESAAERRASDSWAVARRFRVDFDLLEVSLPP